LFIKVFNKNAVNIFVLKIKEKVMGNELNINQFKETLQNYFSKVSDGDDKSIDKENFKNLISDSSIFEQLDLNNDGEISRQEFYDVLASDENQDGIVTKDEIHNNAYKEAEFFAKRTVDKWFTLDVNRDGYWSNVEIELGNYRMFSPEASTDTSLYASMTNKELAKNFKMKEKIDKSNIQLSLESWMDSWLEDDIKSMALEDYGVELSDADMINLKKSMIKQLNTWLFKTGDNKNHDAPLYNSLNTTAYTRLVTHDQTVSCCGGDVNGQPPMGDKPYIDKDGNTQTSTCVKVFSSIEGQGAKNTADEIKNRLAWAMFNCKTNEEAAKMTDEEWNEYKSNWESVRNMTAADFRELLKPKNKSQKKKFEETSLMTVNQIVQYIDIVESTTGKDFDSTGWEVNPAQFVEITLKVNDTYLDEHRLDGKTRADIPKNRRALLRFLEEKGWLMEQFK
jgi:hypothetical protein